MTDFNIVVRPSSSASKEVLPDVVALACTAPESRPRATMDPSILRRRGPVARDASVLLRIETGDVLPSTSGMFALYISILEHSMPYSNDADAAFGIGLQRGYLGARLVSI